MIIKNVPTEDEEQIKLVAWLDRNNILFYHVPNQRKCTYTQGLRFKRLGVKPGVPDVVIPIAKKSYHGLYIELKRTFGGVISDNQEYWLKALRANGHKAEVCLGADEAKKVIMEYLDKKDLS